MGRPSVSNYLLLSFSIVQSKPNQLVLLLADASGSKSYEYDGWRFVPAQPYTRHAMSPGIVALDTAIVHRNAFIGPNEL